MKLIIKKIKVEKMPKLKSPLVMLQALTKILLILPLLCTFWNRLLMPKRAVTSEIWTQLVENLE